VTKTKRRLRQCAQKCAQLCKPPAVVCDNKSALSGTTATLSNAWRKWCAITLRKDRNSTSKARSRPGHGTIKPPEKRSIGPRLLYARYPCFPATDNRTETGLRTTIKEAGRVQVL